MPFADEEQGDDVITGREKEVAFHQEVVGVAVRQKEEDDGGGGGGSGARKKVIAEKKNR